MCENCRTTGLRSLQRRTADFIVPRLQTAAARTDQLPPPWALYADGHILHGPLHTEAERRALRRYGGRRCPQSPDTGPLSDGGYLSRQSRSVTVDMRRWIAVDMRSVAVDMR